MDLKPGEVICNKCHGIDNTSRNYKYKSICKKCYGKGKLDWIDNVIGIKNTPYDDLVRGLLKNIVLIDNLFGKRNGSKTRRNHL